MDTIIQPKKRTILIVDRDIDRASEILLALRPLGHGLILTPEPEQARRKVAAGSIDLLMASFESLAELGLSSEGFENESGIPFIVLGNEARTADLLKAKRMGAIDFIERSCRPITLVEGVWRGLETVEVRERSRVESERLTSLAEIGPAIAHEVSNPLTVICSRTDQLKDLIQQLNVTEKERAALQHLASKIEAASRQISAMLKSILSLSGKSGRDLNETVVLKELFADVANLCRARLRSAEVRFTAAVASPQMSVTCRGSELLQVLINLVTNACDAIESDSEKWIRLEADQIGATIRIRVQDSGGGVPDHLREKIFQPFFTTKPKGKGTGLGLSISKKLVELNQGRIAIAANEPHTCFTIELPTQPLTAVAG